MNNNWIFSKKTDLTVFLTPVLIAVLSLPAIFFFDSKTMPIWAFIALVVTFDVAHVWATIYPAEEEQPYVRIRQNRCVQVRRVSICL